MISWLGYPSNKTQRLGKTNDLSIVGYGIILIVTTYLISSANIEIDDCIELIY